MTMWRAAAAITSRICACVYQPQYGAGLPSAPMPASPADAAAADFG
jgi:hypothetical protein